MKTKKDLRYWAQKALDGSAYGENDCSVKLDVDGKTFNAYTVSVVDGEILFYCDKGTATYFIDNYGDGIPRVELYDWEFSDEN